jgi:hypothetical protein
MTITNKAATDDEWRAYLEPKIESIVEDIGRMRGHLDELERIVQDNRGRVDKQWRDAVVAANYWTPAVYTEQWLKYFEDWRVEKE